MTTKVWPAPVAQNALRPAWPSIARGLLCRCPACGKGALFGAYLKPVAACEACGEDMSPQRADDAPPYFTIVIVGHIVIPSVLTIEMNFDVPVWLEISIWVPVTLLLSLALLQPIKGAVIGWQWAQRMHGFGKTISAKLPPLMSGGDA